MGVTVDALYLGLFALFVILLIGAILGVDRLRKSS